MGWLEGSCYHRLERMGEKVDHSELELQKLMLPLVISILLALYGLKRQQSCRGQEIEWMGNCCTEKAESDEVQPWTAVLRYWMEIEIKGDSYHGYL